MFTFNVIPKVSHQRKSKGPEMRNQRSPAGARPEVLQGLSWGENEEIRRLHSNHQARSQQLMARGPATHFHKASFMGTRQAHLSTYHLWGPSNDSGQRKWLGGHKAAKFTAWSLKKQSEEWPRSSDEEWVPKSGQRSRPRSYRTSRYLPLWDQHLTHLSEAQTAADKLLVTGLVCTTTVLRAGRALPWRTNEWLLACQRP